MNGWTSTEGVSVAVSNLNQQFLFSFSFLSLLVASWVRPRKALTWPTPHWVLSTSVSQVCCNYFALVWFWRKHISGLSGRKQLGTFLNLGGGYISSCLISINFLSNDIWSLPPLTHYDISHDHKTVAASVHFVTFDMISLLITNQSDKKNYDHSRLFSLALRLGSYFALFYFLGRGCRSRSL